MSEDTEWLDTVIPKIAENISLREEDVRYELIKTNHYTISDLYFVRMKYTNDINHLSEEISLVIKKTSFSNVLLPTKIQFHNEILFYQKYRQLGENFPRCFYTYESTSDDINDCSVIALEDVSKSGFTNYPMTANLPYENALAVVRELGRLHAKGYVMKEKNPTEFFRIVDKIEETRFNKATEKVSKEIVNATSRRVVKYLRNNGYDEDFCNKMDALLLNAFDRVVMPITERSEPLSTICHGDVALGNILFKDQDNCNTKAMLIDFGLLRYGSPVIDLSTFFCLCCNDVIRDKFDDIFLAYHIELTNYILQEGLRDIQKYSYNAILEDYKQGCLFGFLVACAFLPCMLGYFPHYPVTENITMVPIAKKCSESGGESMSQLLTDMFFQMKDLGALDRFL